MQHFARNVAARLDPKFSTLGIRDVFVQAMYYNNIFLGKLEDGEHVSMEEVVKNITTRPACRRVLGLNSGQSRDRDIRDLKICVYFEPQTAVCRQPFAVGG
jgi:hypothetical protein